MSTSIDTIVWDLGGVLVDWSPLYVYDDSYFADPADRDFFFKHICTSDWNEQQDAGYPLQKATEEKLAEFPQPKWEQPIRDFYGRWIEMLKGPLPETVELFKTLKAKEQYRFYALTNWSGENFHIALQRFDFLHWFDGRLVSGQEGTRKPFPEFYQLLFTRYQINPARSIFIDDNLRNVKAGEQMGMNSIHFQSAAQLHVSLQELGVL
ncbi:MAG: HAD family phosphatase [Chitinophagaceae bacterium]|nr:HAD family phosphatase [Chitinophagaceae bacterium]NDE77920.1 HAD family phosphatase [Chitinophagaceae bacterium]